MNLLVALGCLLIPVCHHDSPDDRYRPYYKVRGYKHYIGVPVPAYDAVTFCMAWDEQNRREGTRPNCKLERAK